MANTKKLNPAQRRRTKRQMRKTLREMFAKLTSEEKSEFKKAEKKGIRAFVAELAKKKSAANPS